MQSGEAGPVEAHEATLKSEITIENDDSIEREWQLAMSQGQITLDRDQSFNAMATQAKVDPSLFGVYHKWLIRMSRGKLDEEKIGSQRRKGIKAKQGL